MSDKAKTWKFVKSGYDGNVILFGVNIFKYEWNRTGEVADVEDPQYGKRYRFPVYEVTIRGNKYIFATGEFSNTVFGFFVEE